MPTKYMSSAKVKIKAAGFVITILVVVVLGIQDWMNPFNDMEFSQSKWKARFLNERAPMVESLLEDHLQVGMPRSEIESLLGPPDYVNSPRAVDSLFESPPYAIGYELGLWTDRGGGDATFVEVSLNPSGHMTGAKIWWL